MANSSWSGILYYLPLIQRQIGQPIRFSFQVSYILFLRIRPLNKKIASPFVSNSLWRKDELSCNYFRFLNVRPISYYLRSRIRTEFSFSVFEHLGSYKKYLKPSRGLDKGPWHYRAEASQLVAEHEIKLFHLLSNSLDRIAETGNSNSSIKFFYIGPNLISQGFFQSLLK